MKITRIQVGLAAAVAIAYAVLSCIVFGTQGIDNIGDFETMSDGHTVVTSYDGNQVNLNILDENGGLAYQTTINRDQKEGTLSIADIAVDQDGVVYLLVDYLDPLTGKYQSQGMEIYDPSKFFGKHVESLLFSSTSDLRYRWLEMGTTSLTMMGVNNNNSLLTRELYDVESLQNGQPLLKGEREYTITASEGIFEAEPVGTDVAYITMSGKIFLAGQDGTAAKELYPARVLEELMYPSFIASNGDSSLIVGEQESGDLLTLEIANGATTTYKKGSEPFSGLSSYAPADILVMSMSGKDNFTGAVKNDSTGYYELVVSNDGDISVIDSLDGSIMTEIVDSILTGIILFLALLALSLAFNFVVDRVLTSRSIRTKLIISTLPILCVAIVCLGFFTYSSYADSIEESFYKQIEDEGSMLTALFGSESFAEIEFPYDYPDEAYQYLNQQMLTRDIYTRTGYFEYGNFYIGVDTDNPCFYNIDTLLNNATRDLYALAAYSGVSQTTMVSDKRGERLSCVTPIGGGNGTTVYLLETGISVENMTSYTRSYLINFALIAGLFLLSIGTLMVMAFIRILRPLHEIKEGLEVFSTGDRSVRLDAETNDEFSDISRVFNKLAGDIDLQIYELDRVSQVYYRFIPQQMLRLLDTENLGNIELGSSIRGEYIVLMAGLKLSNLSNTEHTQDLTNTFFNTIRDVCDDSDTATLLSDRANLRQLFILCPSGAEEAVATALSAVAKIDAINATLPIQLRMEVSFVVHKADIYYGICGDENRFIPALISNEMDWLTEQIPFFTQLSSRLIVTTKAYAELESTNYFNRFIGTLGEDKVGEHGLYDFYDSTPPEHTRLINATLATFNKAMSLYEEGRYYEAKNLFVLVLRENRFDNVARHYLFECEKHMPSSLSGEKV